MFYSRLFFLLGLLALPTVSLACTCDTSSLQEHFRDVDIVFEGRVLSSEIDQQDYIINTPGTASYSITDRQSTRKTIFEITRPLKGRAAETRAVYHSTPSGGNCGIGFTPGETYRVFAYRTDAGLSTSSCTHSSSLEPNELKAKWREEVRATLLSNESSAKEKEDVFDSMKYLGYAEFKEKVDNRFFEDYVWAVEHAVTTDELDYFFYYIEDFEKFEDYENLADAYLNAAKLAPQNAVFPIGAGEAFLKLGEFSSAVLAFETAQQIDPKSRSGRTGLAKARLALKGRFDNTVSDYTELKFPSLNISGARGKTIDLSGAIIQKISADGAAIEHLVMEHTKIWAGSFTGARLPTARFDSSEFSRSVDMSEIDLRGGSLVDSKYLQGNFSGANLYAVNAQRSTFERANFSEATLDRSDFSNASLSRSDFTGAHIGTASFQSARLFNTNFANTDLRRASLKGAELRGARVNCKTRLPRTLDTIAALMISVEPTCGRRKMNRDFSGKDLGNTDFSGLDLTNSDFNKANFAGGEFYDSGLQEANFSASTGRATFSGANLTGANFTNSKLRAAFFESAPWHDPDNKRPAAIIHNVDFSGAALSTYMFVGERHSPSKDIDVSKAVFRGASIKCDNKHEFRRVQEYESGEYKDEYFESLSPEQRDYHEQWFKRNYEYARNWLDAEGALIRQLKSVWPSLQLDEECLAYFEN